MAWHQECSEGLLFVEFPVLAAPACGLELIGIWVRQQDATGVKGKSLVLAAYEVGNGDDTALVVEGCISCDGDVESEEHGEKESALSDSLDCSFAAGASGTGDDDGGVEERGDDGGGKEVEEREEREDESDFFMRDQGEGGDGGEDRGSEDEAQAVSGG